MLVDNIRDDNFYDLGDTQSLPYIAGFFSSVFNEYFDRNVMTVDAFDWIHRTGANPPDEPDPNDACASAPARPFSTRATFAHEYQHLLEYYADPDELPVAERGSLRLGDDADRLRRPGDADHGRPASNATSSASSADLGIADAGEPQPAAQAARRTRSPRGAIRARQTSCSATTAPPTP